MMKKGQCYEAVVERVQFPAKGILTYKENAIGEGGAETVTETKVTLKNTIPGQKVSFRVSKKKKGRADGTVLEILEKAPNEIEPACPHFGSCGGCNYQNLSYADQLNMKESQIKEILDSVYKSMNMDPDYSYEGIKKSPVQFEYRNKMEFSFGDSYKDGPLALGLHKRGSFYDIVSVSDCRIVDEDYRSILKTTLAFFTDQEIPFYHRMRQQGYLRHLLVRKAVRTGEILVALVTSSDLTCFENGPERENSDDIRQSTIEKENVMLTEWKDALLALQESGKLHGSFAGILHTVNDAVADVVKADHTDILYGKDFFYEELLGLKFKISQFSFFQTNSLGAEVLYGAARDYVGKLSDGTPDKIVYDLYSGTGTIAQMLAPVSRKVIGVEIVEEAVEAAKENAELNGLHNCEFIAGDVLKVLDNIEEKPDMIVLDPPRDGIHPKALEKILNYKVDRIVYISCKPTSLARDLEVFFARGYHMDKACCVDMFAGTPHVETVVLMSKVR